MAEPPQQPLSPPTTTNNEQRHHQQHQEQDDEEEDYMGDLSKFLTNEPLPKSTKKLPTNQKPEPAKKKPKTHLNWAEQKRLERERTQQDEDQKTLENLNSAIPQSNIGFKLLKQMGYTPGQGLGPSGRVDPVGVEIRRGRAGIGREDPAKERARREKEKAEREMRRVEGKRRRVEEMVEEFGFRQRMQWKCKRVVICYRKAKAALDQLENKEDVVVVEEEESDGEDEDEEEEVITEEDLLEILVKLREEHRYCLFCGCQYESSEALLDNCPGISEDDH